jgi:hypothetical protein
LKGGVENVYGFKLGFECCFLAARYFVDLFASYELELKGLNNFLLDARLFYAIFLLGS